MIASIVILKLLFFWSDPLWALHTPVPPVEIHVPPVPKDPLWEKPHVEKLLAKKGQILVSVREIKTPAEEIKITEANASAVANETRINEANTSNTKTSNTDASEARITFTILGLAEVRGEPQEVFRRGTNWSKLEQFSVFFAKSAFYPENSQVAVDLGILGFRPSLLTQVSASEQRLEWRVVQGPFAGLTGVMLFEPAPKQKGHTWIKSWGSYAPKSPPWSDQLTVWVLEGCLERVASSLKRYVEGKGAEDTP